MEERYYSRLIKVLIFVIDFYLIGAAFNITKRLGLAEGIPEDQSIAFCLIFSLLWVISGFFNEIYRINKLSLLRSIGINLLNTLLVHFLLISLVLFTFKQYRIEFSFLTLPYLFTTIFIMFARVAYKFTWKYFEFSGFDQRQVVIVGASRSGKALHHFFVSHDFTRYQFRGFFDDDPENSHVNKNLIKGKVSDLKAFCIENKIDEIYFAMSQANDTLLQDISKFADDNFIYFRIAPEFSDVITDRYDVFLFDSIPIISTRKEPLGLSINAGLKRLFDIVFSMFVILTVFPVLVPLIAIAIRFDSPGPIIFKQLRVGKKNKLFECYKFRTMLVNSNNDVQATKNDPRITRIGHFLRKTNLDEFPQFVNVLLGNMSVVGPRPHINSQLEQYSILIRKYKVRHFVTPGITGYAQVNGFRGETREVGQMAKRVEYDVIYMENWSLLLDIKIIFLTVWNMLKGEKSAY